MFCSDFSPFLILWKAFFFGIFFRSESNRLFIDLWSVLVHWCLGIFSFSLGVRPEFWFLVSLGVVAGGEALVGNAVSQVLLLNKAHETTNTGIVGLEDSEVVVCVVLLTILFDLIMSLLNFQLLLISLIDSISFVQFIEIICLSLDCNHTIMNNGLLLRKLSHLLVSLVSLHNSLVSILRNHVAG